MHPLSWLAIVRLSLSILLMAVLYVAPASASGPVQHNNQAPERSAQQIHYGPWLHTQGQQILDSVNRPVVFHGINSSGMEWGAGYERIGGKCPTPGLGCWTRPVLSEYDNLSAVGFNMVRLPISWANIEPDPPTTGADGKYVHHYNENYLRAIEDVVNNFGSHRLYVVLSMHQWGWSPVMTIQKHGGKVVHGNGLPGWLFNNSDMDQTLARRMFFSNERGMQDMLADAWHAVAARFKNNSALVGADMFNEPELKGENDGPQAKISGSTNLDKLYFKLGNSIRNANPNLLLIFQESRSEPVSTPPPFQNVVYSFHSYPQGENWQREKNSWVANHMRKAAFWNVPLWVGEFQALGPLDHPYGPDGFIAKTSPELQFYKENGIGWCYWAYQKATRPLAGEHGKGPCNDALVRLLRSGF